MCTRLTVAILVAAGLLSACGGGGEGTVVRPFTAFSAIQPGQTVEASGVSQTASATLDSSSGNVISRTVNEADTANSSMRLTYGSGLALTGISITTPQSSVAWRGGQIDCSAGVICGAANDGGVGFVMNALDANVSWNYQTFGFWLALPNATTGIAGAISMGNPTPVNAIPTTGSATYNGFAGGTYVNTDGAPFAYAANMAATANFGTPGTGTVSFATNDSTIAPLLTGGSPVANPGLDLSGILSIAAGANQFTGTVNTAATPPGNLTGTATGRFYGPAYEEIGGVFALKPATGTSVETLVGGFGGKRP